MPDDLAEMLNEIVARIEKLEENQAALEGAINAFIAVFAVRRLPDKAAE
jgi:exonuclease VII small subunit